GRGRQALLGLDIDRTVDDVGCSFEDISKVGANLRQTSDEESQKQTKTTSWPVTTSSKFASVRIWVAIASPSCRCADAPPRTSTRYKVPNQQQTEDQVVGYLMVV